MHEHTHRGQQLAGRQRYLRKSKRVKRDLHTREETITYKKRPQHMKRDLNKWKETITKKKDLWNVPTYSLRKLKRARTAGRPKTASEVCQVGQKRPKHMKRDVYTLKEIVTFKKRSGRRHLRYAKWVKRDLHIWKEMYAHEKRPLRVKIEVEDDIWDMPNGSKEI